MTNPNSNQAGQQIENAAQQVIALRNRPLLVLYYPGSYGDMGPQDVEDCYQSFRNANITPEDALEDCDVLVHTLGGDPVTGFRMAQCLHDFAKKISFLIPKYSYSAGTLLCFSGNQLRFGHCAGLSPIDIKFVPEVVTPQEREIELATIDSFMDFAVDSQRRVQQILLEFGISECSDVSSNLLCTLVEKVGALKVALYYRERMLTGHYAQELLDRYMLMGLTNSEGRRDTIINRFLFSSPSHEFHIDYHMCSDLGLEVVEMVTPESDATKNVVTTLDELTTRRIICPNLTDDHKMPFIALFMPTSPTSAVP
jgi:hypothetical protein